MRRLSKLLLPLFIGLVLPGLIFAQGQLGSLTGSITDSSGAYVAEAPITITNTKTGAVVKVKASTAGYYRLPVQPGTYKVEVAMQGFKTALAQNIEVPVAQVVTVDLKLEVGSTSQSVTVTTEAPLLTPSTAEVGSAVSPLEFQTLPIQIGDGGRNPQAFIFSSLPGTQGDTWSGSINGGQLFSHEILVDGVTIGRYDLAGGGMDEYSPGTDAIGEFKVQMSNYSAEYGNTGGGIANFSLKSGTNQFHGTLFEYNKNPVFNAAGFDANAFGTPKDNEKENNFGGTIGGPIRKDKTFFFFSYEGDRFRSFAYSGTVTIPTKAMTGGNFGEILGGQLNTCGDTEDQPCVDALGRPVMKNGIYDPTTTRDVSAGVLDTTSGLVATEDGTVRDPFPGNVIPQSEFSTATSTLLPLFPSPLLGGTNRNTPEFAGCCPILNRDAYNAKVDHVITSNQRLSVVFGYYKRFRWHRTNQTFPPFPGQPINPTKNQITGGPQVRISHSWTLNDHSVNVFTAGYNRFNNANNLSNNAKFTSAMGIPGVIDACFPNMTFGTSNTNITALIRRLGVACANIDPSESYIYQDTFSTTRGRHSWKFGAELTRYRYNTFEPGSQSGSFAFNSKETALPGFTNSTGSPFASFVLGATDSASRSVYQTEPGYRAGSLAFFAQDDWKATSKLTLNLGVRWDIPLPKKEVFNRQSGFDPTALNPDADNIPGALVFLGSCSGCINRDSFQDMYWKEFAPRIGVAYQITNHLVFRGGYGISYSPPILNNFGTQNLSGYNGAVTVHRSGTPSSIDPVIFLTPLASAPLPSWAKVGLPSFTGTLPNRDPSSFNGNGLDFLPRTSLAQPYTQNWSLGFQYEMPHQIMIEADYVAAKGSRLLDSNFATDFNPLNAKYLALGNNLDMDFQDALNAGILQPYGITQLPYPNFENNNWDTSVATGLLPYPQYSGLTNNYPTMGSSTYHSLQVQARKNTTKGLTFIAAYTFSKTLTDTDTALYYPSYAVQDFYNRKLEKSIASFDHPQTFKLTWIYSLPFGRGQKWLTGGGPSDRLFSGWQITAIQQYSSGDPLFVSSSLNTGLGSGNSVLPGLRADALANVPQTVTPGPLDVAGGGGTQYLNPLAFADPPDSNGDGSGYPLRIGTGPRYLPSTRGPGHSNEDFGIIKNTRINERFNFQIRADMFNVFNRTGLANPDTSLGDGSDFGKIFDVAHGPRIIQFALRLNF